MRLGYFHDYEVPIKWIPADKKFSLLNFTVVGGAVPLSSEKYSWVKGFVSQAYYCENCHIVIANGFRATENCGVFGIVAFSLEDAFVFIR